MIRGWEDMSPAQRSAALDADVCQCIGERDDARLAVLTHEHDPIGATARAEVARRARMEAPECLAVPGCACGNTFHPLPDDGRPRIYRL